ncbi:MAG: Dps family protein [Rikenellaceae bacterium]
MKTLTYIHLDEQKTAKVVDELQILLADYQIFYTNIRGFHWNIKGKNFFQLHAKFEELYLDASEKVDDIAERILTLGGVPKNSFTDYLKMSTIGDISAVSCAENAMKDLLENIGVLIEEEKKVFALASEADDDSTVSMMSDYIREQEKLVWMLVSYFTDSCKISD